MGGEDGASVDNVVVVDTVSGAGFGGSGVAIDKLVPGLGVGTVTGLETVVEEVGLGFDAADLAMVAWEGGSGTCEAGSRTVATGLNI